jgi:hypothetical protein
LGGQGKYCYEVSYWKHWIMRRGRGKGKPPHIFQIFKLFTGNLDADNSIFINLFNTCNEFFAGIGKM